MRNPLLDTELLKELDSHRSKIIFARLTALTFDEDPVEQIEGKITGGSISIDGTSAVRRTCSLTLVAEEVNITDFYWGIKTKVRVEVGLQHKDDIIWFPQGIFVLNSFNTSYSTSGFTISISGQDKMCLLNGTLGGSLPASIDFGQIEDYTSDYSVITFENKTDFEGNKYYYKNAAGEFVKAMAEYGYDNEGNKIGDSMVYYEQYVDRTLTKVPLRTIIKEAVHTYANEPYYNIVINDLDDTGLELMEYRGEDPMYFLFDETATICENVLTSNSHMQVSYLLDSGDWSDTTMDVASLPEEYFDTITEVLENKPCRLKTVSEKVKVANEVAPPFADSTEGFILKEATKLSVAGLREGDTLEITFKSGDTVLFTADLTGTYKAGSEVITDIRFNAETAQVYDDNGWSPQDQIRLSYQYIEGYEYKVRVMKCKYGDAIGYRITDLVYTGDLITQVGETLTNGVLDKIVNMLGDYEYFYDTNGQFIFRRKATYLNISWNSLVNTKDETYAENAAQASRVEYNFEGNQLLSSVSNTPQLNNIKNDFSVFGERKGISSEPITVHMRLAIDEKPDYYRAFDGTVYYSDSDTKEPQTAFTKKIKCDWREIIYQMALDFYAHNQEDDFLVDVCDNNKYTEGNELFIPFPLGLTGYEQYYIDLQGFWRELYNPEPPIEYSYTGGVYEEVKVPLTDTNKEGAYVVENKWVPMKKVEGSMTCDFYLPKEQQEEGDPDENFTTDPDLYYWNKSITEAPDTLNFWLDFIDTEGALGKYSVKAIGDRTKAINDKDVKSIYYQSVPNVIFFGSMDEYTEHEIKTGYLYVILPEDFLNQFTLSARGKSAKDAIDTLLYTYTYGAETVSLSSIPIYHLEPNQRIYVHDENSVINDEYVVRRINIPLSATGTMTVEGAKAPQRIY